MTELSFLGDQLLWGSLASQLMMVNLQWKSRAGKPLLCVCVNGMNGPARGQQRNVMLLSVRAKRGLGWNAIDENGQKKMSLQEVFSRSGSLWEPLAVIPGPMSTTTALCKP